MATSFSYTVDTTPMAREMNSVTKQVMGTTTAVVTMQAAVIAAEKAASNHICSNVNRGFFALMRSQISQKLANKQSRVEALLIHLGYQKRRLLTIKANMERDYGRIAARYLRIFTNINKELEKRIRQIDQPVFELVSHHMVASTNRMFALAGQVNTMQDESLSDSQQILMSRVKWDTQVALEKAATFLSRQGEQRALSEKILHPRINNSSDSTFAIPVVMLEGINDSSGNVRMDLAMPNQLSSAQQGAIRNVFYGKQDYQWQDQQKCDKVVSDNFLNMLNSSGLPERNRQLIVNLFNNSHMQTI